MKKLFTASMLAAAMLAAVQASQAQTFIFTADSAITGRDASTGAPVLEPVEMVLTVHKGEAVVAYSDVNGVHEFVGKAYQADDGAIIFAGLAVKMPAGDFLRFCFGEPAGGRFKITAHYVGAPLNDSTAITLPFTPSAAPQG